MKKIYFFLFILLSIVSCRENDEVIPTQPEETGGAVTPGNIIGMYVLNEGAMGSNKASIDYLDLSADKAVYLRNIYAERNPTEVKELGDVGNDIKIYGSRLWMVINASNKVEVATVDKCKKIGKIDIANCRYLAFDGKYAYVSSYVGPIDMTADCPLGCVCKIDTATLQIVARTTVGYQPDEMAIVGRKLYVANSGGYRAPDYDNTVSVINLETFSEERKIDVAINLHHCRADKYGQLWVSSRGDYGDIPSNLYWLQPDAHGQMQVAGKMNIPVSDFCIVGDSLYYYSSAYSMASQKFDFSYGIVNIKTHQVVADRLTDAQEMNTVEMPYGLIVNPQHRDFYLMDAKNFLSSGELLHFRSDGTFDWRVSTGDIPAHAVFVYRKEEKP